MKARGPRERLLLSAIALMCERGVHATGLADLLDHSKTARGSIYQHFPGGKSDLMEQATYAAGRTISALLDEFLAARTPAGALAGMIDYWKQILADSDYVMGCPILAAAQAGPSEPAVQVASATVFATWAEKLAAALVDNGAGPTEAAQLASLAVSSIEGATAQCRGARSTQPLDDVRDVLIPLVENAFRPTNSQPAPDLRRLQTAGPAPSGSAG